MTRQEQIAKNQIWQVYPDEDYDNILFEGRKTKCMAFLKENHWRSYKNGTIRLAKVIWEKDENKNL